MANERGQQGECMRCGEVGLAANLIRDGRNPRLLVFPDCYDPPHPAEKPYVPKTTEGKARFPVATELLPSPTGLALATNVAGSEVRLDWTLLQHEGPVPSRYELYRSLDGGAYSLVMVFGANYEIERQASAITPRQFRDTGLAAGTYRYRLDAVIGDPPVVLNGGFEDGRLSKWLGPPNVVGGVPQFPAPQGEIAANPGGHSGNYCVKIASATSPGGPNILSTRALVEPGQVYFVTAYALRDETDIPGANGRLAVRRFGAAGNSLGPANITGGVNAPDRTVAGRQRLYGTYTVESGVYQLSIDAAEAMVPPGYWFYDDFAMWRTDVPQPSNEPRFSSATAIAVVV